MATQTSAPVSSNANLIPATRYASSYASTYTNPSGFLSPAERALLRSVNCSYLSSNTPPTLLALKQHAHALVNLIRKLSVSTAGRSVDAGDDPERSAFNQDEAFDWLNNLDVPYENEDEAHQLPLWAVANTVAGESDVKGVEHHCPLKKAKELGPLTDQDGERRPYQTHHNLVMHANECLEILDHEYGATGGLMSILPTTNEYDSAQLSAARNTLLGQWLLHHQHLVARMHELEINYANALDLLAGEAVVPLQLRSHADTGREIAFPQDKFVLANAGDDVFAHLHRLLDQEEAQTEHREKTWKNSGVSGERMWLRDADGVEYSRGLVAVELVSRFYRVKEQGSQSPIFVIPALQKHPAVGYTLKIEERPTVVSVVTPVWPERVSDLEAKHKRRLDKATETEIVNARLVRERLELMDKLAVKNAELKRGATFLQYWEDTVGKSSLEREKELLDQIEALEQDKEKQKERDIEREKEWEEEKERVRKEEEKRMTNAINSCIYVASPFGESQ